jgi:hypothetical protein
MHYSQLLAGFSKVAQVPGRRRLIMLAADDGYVRYIEQSGRSVLPLKAGETELITPSSLGRLADTPRQKAESHGTSRELRTKLRWTGTTRGCSLVAWEVAPGTGRHRRLLASMLEPPLCVLALLVAVLGHVTITGCSVCDALFADQASVTIFFGGEYICLCNRVLPCNSRTLKLCRTCGQRLELATDHVFKSSMANA